MTDPQRKTEIEKLAQTFIDCNQEMSLRIQELELKLESMTRERDFYRNLSENKANILSDYDGKLRLVKGGGTHE